VKEIEELDEKMNAVGNKNDFLDNYNKLITVEAEIEAPKEEKQQEIKQPSQPVEQESSDDDEDDEEEEDQDNTNDDDGFGSFKDLNFSSDNLSGVESFHLIR